jgi:hypothetical protein
MHAPCAREQSQSAAWFTFISREIKNKTKHCLEVGTEVKKEPKMTAEAAGVLIKHHGDRDAGRRR